MFTSCLLSRSLTLGAGLTIGRTISVVHSRSLDKSNAKEVYDSDTWLIEPFNLLTMSIWINAIRPILSLQKIMYTMLDHTDLRHGLQNHRASSLFLHSPPSTHEHAFTEPFATSRPGFHLPSDPTAGRPCQASNSHDPRGRRKSWCCSPTRVYTPTTHAWSAHRDDCESDGTRTSHRSPRPARLRRATRTAIRPQRPFVRPSGRRRRRGTVRSPPI